METLFNPAEIDFKGWIKDAVKNTSRNICNMQVQMRMMMKGFSTVKRLQNFFAYPLLF